MIGLSYVVTLLYCRSIWDVVMDKIIGNVPVWDNRGGGLGVFQLENKNLTLEKLMMKQLCVWFSVINTMEKETKNTSVIGKCAYLLL